MASQHTQSEITADLNTAARLEAQLKALAITNGKTETKASELRIKLCEVFSDVLLSDCTTALRKDVAGRLWYSCFYNRIQELRQRIAKEKSKVKKQRTAGASSEGGKDRIKNAEESLKTFIQEGITLYTFLVDRLQGSLIPNSESQSQSQSSDVSQLYSKGTIPALHKLYIHVGDMHRYASSFSDAEKAYLQASKLAPSKGNPYNQMAVVAQLKETNGYPLPAMALYWYCRSLCSTEVFETSKSNVERLFSANEKWLLKSDAIFGADSPPLQDSLNGCDKEEGKQIKSTASRMVLSRFAAFHGRLFLSKSEMLDDNLLLRRFREILDVNPFGGGLMIKLVTINIFSAWNSAKSNNKIAPNAYAFLIKFANHICQSMEGILEKLEAKLEKGKGATNIRLLGPLLLTCEFISHEMDVNNPILKKHSDDGMFQKNLFEFWSSLGRVATMITNSKTISHILNIETLRSDACILPDDFKSLSRGCRPLSFLGIANRESEDKGAYIDQEEAVTALGLSVTQTQSQMSQRSKKSSTTDKSVDPIESENRIKLARFMAFLTKHIQSGELVRIKEKVIEAAPQESEDKDTVNEENESTVEFLSPSLETMEASLIASQEKAEDLLVYKQAEKGQPALLTPNALLLGETKDVNDGSDLLKLSALIDSNMKKKQKSSPPYVYDSKDENMHVNDQILSPMPPKPVPIMVANEPVRPPPGFQAPSYSLPPPKNQVPQARAPPSLSSGGDMHNPGLSSLPFHQAPQQFSPFVNSDVGSIEQNSRLPPGFGPSAPTFNQMPQTRNAFASRLHNSYGVNSSALPSPGSFMNAQSFNNESLLGGNGSNDFGLNDQDPFGLRSLGILSDEERTPSTRNPFHFG